MNLSECRRLANWLNLTTPLGLAVARLGRAQVRPGPQGLILGEGYHFRFPSGSAFTIGNVVVTRHDFTSLARRLPGLLRHESVHANQYALLGQWFWPLYGGMVLWSLWRTGDRAAACALERWAGLADGGYHDVASRRF